MPLTHFEIRGRREHTQGQASVVTNPPPTPKSLLVLKVHFWTTRFHTGNASIVPCYPGTALAGNHWTVVAAMVFLKVVNSHRVDGCCGRCTVHGVLLGVQVVTLLGVLGWVVH